MQPAKSSTSVETAACCTSDARAEPPMVPSKLPSTVISAIASPARAHARQQRKTDKEPVHEGIGNRRQPAPGTVIAAVPQFLPNSPPSVSLVPDQWDDDDDDDCIDVLGSVLQAPADSGLMREGPTDSRALERTDWNTEDKDEQEHPSKRDGHHSRLRKDLVNLNRSVVKWLAQQEKGFLTGDEVVHRILQSAAVKTLSAAHGSKFQEAEFVQDAISRGAAIVDRRSRS